MSQSIAVLHPGEMGVSVARALADAGQEPCWLPAGRSPATLARAAAFTAYENLPELLSRVSGVFSVCPPHAALAQAEQVAAAGFSGTYVDANAVAPSTAVRIADIVGAGYVDGGIIGPPALSPDTTRLYVSGPGAEDVVAWFSGSKLQAIAVSTETTAASSLKMAYAAFTKGSSALLLAVNALAEHAGVRDALVAEWMISQPGLVKRSANTALGTSRKAWRFAGEMEEISRTFAEAGLPGEIHAGAADVFQRMAGLKDLPPSDLEKVLQALLD